MSSKAKKDSIAIGRKQKVVSQTEKKGSLPLSTGRGGMSWARS